MTSQAQAKAQQMLDAVRAGKTLFTKAPDEWQIVGPDAQIQPGAPVTVTKADGSTTQVIVQFVRLRREVQGVAYATATFSQIREPRPVRTSTGRPQRDRSADRVARLTGLPAPRATGNCHYCGLPLTNGYCEECQ